MRSPSISTHQDRAHILMTYPENKIIIRHGIEHPTGAGTITGVSASREDDGTPSVVLAVKPTDTTAANRDLRPGETFVIGREKWQMADLRRVDTPDWYAILTRVR